MIKRRSAMDLKQAWWSFGLRGTAALVIGLILVLWLSRDTELLFGVFGAYMLADGLIELWLAAGQARRRERWWQTATSGGLGVLLGLSNMLGRGLSPGDRVYMISPRGPRPAASPVS